MVQATRSIPIHYSGGGDAVVTREFDLKAKEFVAQGFDLVEAKSFATWRDDDSVLFGTDFGSGSLTSSGYPRVVNGRIDIGSFEVQGPTSIRTLRSPLAPAPLR